MPVIYTATFPIRVNRDGTIDILKKLRQDVKERGCVDLPSVSEQYHTSLEYVQTIARQLAGDGAITCDKDGMYCCVDESRLHDFVNKMKQLRSKSIDGGR